MPKNKRPVPRNTAKETETDADQLAQALVDHALAIAEREEGDAKAQAEHEQAAILQVRRMLRRRHDDVLVGAIELARYTDADAARWLAACIEEEAATLHIHGEDGGAGREIDVFMIPLFVNSTGGLLADEVFRDDADFEALTDSFRQAGLASPDTRLVLVRHLYDFDAVDRIRYSELQDMLREAAQALRAKKLVATPAIEASMRPWEGVEYEPEDAAMELRFLLGFALKPSDDPFYAVPDDEAAADAYFEARLARYRMWAGSVAPLLQRCLSRHPAGIELNFLYQDLFYGAKAQGLGELAMLAAMAQVGSRLDAHERAPERTKAVVAPVEADGEAVLRINLYPLDGGAPLATIDKPLAPLAHLESELADLCDALGTLGLDGVLLARGFDAGGEPEDAQPYLAA